jgi:hypothetical protein
MRGLCIVITLAAGSLPALASAQTQPAPGEPAGAQPVTPLAKPANGAPDAPAAGTTLPTPPGTTTGPTPGAAGAPIGPIGPDAKAPETKWYDAINLGAFVDAYYSQNWNGPRSNSNVNTFQPYTNNTGFNLAWIGLDASVDPAPVGATLQLRFGPAVPNLALGDFAIPGGIGFVQNGFVSWKPQGKDGKLTLMLGKFDTVYGAEVAQSQLNMNYTRGYLYNLAQPFFHTGLRADLALTEMLSLKLLAVNGWNNTIDNNKGKSIGAQITITPAEQAAISVGYMGGPEESDLVAVPATATTPATTVPNIGANSRFRHLVDVVADLKPTKDFRVVVNGDYVTQAAANPVGPSDITQSWYGAAILARYAFTDVWAAAVRGEYIKDKDGFITATGVDTALVTGTLTLEAAPHKMLLIRLDNRIDSSDQESFQTLHGTSKSQFTTTLGVVAKTN